MSHLTRKRRNGSGAVTLLVLLLAGAGARCAAAIPGPLGAEAHAIVAEDSFRAGLAKRWYQELLGRPPSPAESRSAVERLQAGKQGWLAMITAIAGGDDYFRRAGSANQGFVTRLFRDLIGREPDTKDELPGALDFLMASPRAELVDVLTDTDDFRQHVVEGEYRHFLGRTGTEQELTEGTGTLKENGLSELVARIITSDEYFEKRGGATADGWRMVIFRDLQLPAPAGSGGNGSEPSRNLPAPERSQPAPNRVPPTSGSAEARDQVVATLLTRPEYLTDVVQTTYRRFLHRPATEAEEEHWLAALGQGGSPDQVLRALLTSDEYFDRAGGTMKQYRSRLMRDLFRQDGSAGPREPSTRDRLIDLLGGLRKKKRGNAPPPM